MLAIVYRRVATPHRFHIRESCDREMSVNVCQHTLHNNPKERRQPTVSTRLWSAANGRSSAAVLQPRLLDLLLGYRSEYIACATGWRTEVRFQAKQRILSAPNHPNRLCNPPRLLFNW